MKDNEKKTLLRSSDDLIAAVEQYGFLPFFRNEIHGFSIEELCPPELWFADDVDGPWEWKGCFSNFEIISFVSSFIRNKHLIYEKQEDRTKWKNLFTG